MQIKCTALQQMIGFDWGRRKTKKKHDRMRKLDIAEKRRSEKVQTTTTKNRGEKNETDQSKKYNQIIALIGMQGSPLRLGVQIN